MILNNEEITFVGFGNMGSAIVGGILKENIFTKINIIESDTSKFKLKEKRLNFIEKINSEINSSKFIFLCVKPQSFDDLSKIIKNFLSEDQILISIMAGIKISNIQDYTEHEKVVRIMPNTPAQVSRGISVWKSSDNISNNDKITVEKILNSFGKCIEVESENIIDICTALSGSGPGFIYKFLESMISAGEKSGLDKEMSRILAIETLIGSSELLRITNESPKKLREAVTSPGGTTEAGLNFMKNNDFEEIIFGTIKAAIDKSIELSKES